jgi:hypothetical protein
MLQVIFLPRNRQADLFTRRSADEPDEAPTRWLGRPILGPPIPCEQGELAIRCQCSSGRRLLEFRFGATSGRKLLIQSRTREPFRHWGRG